MAMKEDPSKITADMLRTDFTEAEKNVLKAKKETFEMVYPLLMTYNSYIQKGAVPPGDLEYQIVTALNRLLVAIE
jgi:hypothetical protein